MALEPGDVIVTSISKQLADSIRTAIMDGRLKVDDRLPTEDELARQFGISRPTVREALKRLAAQNLIRSKRGPAGGNFVCRPDPTVVSDTIAGVATLLVGVGAFDIQEIFSARFETESICCRLACANRDESHLTRMRTEIAVQRRTATTDEEFCASDVRFHRALVDAAANGPLGLMMYTVIEAFIPITNLITFRQRERAQVIALHEAIMAAVRDKDSDACIARLRELLDCLNTTYLSAVATREAHIASKGPSR